MRLIEDTESSDLYRSCKDYRMIFSTNEKVYDRLVPIMRKPIYAQIRQVWGQHDIISREVEGQHDIS